MGELAKKFDEYTDVVSLGSCPEIMSAVGTDFFHLLNRHLAKKLSADIVYIAEINLHSKGHLQTLAAYRDGENIPDYSYLAAGTPCAIALSESVVICRDDLQKRFPESNKLQPGLRSFFAAGLQDGAGESIGVLALGWCCTDPDIETAKQSVQVIMNRVSAELQRIRVARVLEEQLHFTQEILDAIPIPVFYKDRQLRYLGCNREFENAIGRTRTEIVGKTSIDTISDDNYRRYHKLDKSILKSGQSHAYEEVMQYGDGSERAVVFNKAAMRDSERRISGVIGTMFDMSELKNAEQRIHRLAHYDHLTGLPNRQSFIDHLNKALAANLEEKKYSIAVLCLDVDHFKSLGHSIGAEACNSILQTFSERLTRFSRCRDLY
ncbi:MAG TPA: diguanylate cyclase, partial [Geopsychrobacteraceae bacterium]|nr:diguanylate cyclase [Geopsychrobacteraceae bacterium]